MAEPAIELTSPSVQGSASRKLEAPPAAIVFDERAHAVSIDGRYVVLTPREYLLLDYFVDHLGSLLTRRQLLHEVWGLGYEGGPRTVDIHVSRLRRKLGPTVALDTLRGLGYRFGSRNGQQARGALEAVK
jgi:DNA-binding response OmpR family regulator